MGLVYAYIVFAFLIIIIEITRQKSKFFDFLTAANIYFLIGYVFAPVYFELATSTVVEYNVSDKLIVFFTSVSAYVFLCLGWVLFGKKSIGLKKYASLINKGLINNNYLIRASKIFLAIGVLSAFLYLFSLGGGLLKALQVGSLVRYGFEEPQIGFFAFTKNIMRIVPVVTLFFFGVLVSKSIHNKYSYLILYFIGLMVFLLYAFVTSSRGALMNFFLFHYLVYIKINEKLKIKLLLILFVAGIFFMVFGKQIFYATAMFFSGHSFIEEFNYLNNIRLEGFANFFEIIAREFAHCTISVDVAYTYAGKQIPYTFYSDYLWSALRIIPQRVVSIFINTPDTISLINTYLIEGREVASIPPGIVAYNIYALGKTGLVFGMFLYGIIGRIINNEILKSAKTNELYYVFFVLFAQIYGAFIVNGDPNVVIYLILWPFIIYFLLKKRLVF